MYIYTKIIVNAILRFVFSDVIWALEEFFNPYILQNNKSTVEFQTSRSVFSKELSNITDEQNGFLRAFSILEDGYSEMKESFNLPCSGNRTSSSLLKDFKSIQEIIEGKPITTDEDQIPSSMSFRRALKHKAFMN